MSLKAVPTLAVAAAVFAAVLFAKTGLSAESFSPYVDDKGNISMPKDFRSWYFLGTWGIAADEGNQVGSKGFHSVYTQPGTVAAFHSTGKFPDGAVVVKELLKAKTNTMTTGEISYATETDGWFVMIKDNQGRFKDSALWGDGWGWALFNAGDPTTTVTKDYKSDCLPCHVPAEKDDWIYLRGYPTLRE
jgi:hypothetical protein